MKTTMIRERKAVMSFLYRFIRAAVLIYLIFILVLCIAAEAADFTLYKPGAAPPVDYQKYGEFTNLGAPNYNYKITDRQGLKEAAGEGIYPDLSSVSSDPLYIKYKDAGLLSGSHWDFIDIDDHALSFYKWATAAESPGVKQYQTALALEKAGLYEQALKAYYAVLVHFPKEVGWTYFNTPWYVGKVSIAKIKYICRKHPELGLRLVDARIKVKNGFDSNVRNDEFEIINPGRLVSIKDNPPEKINLEKQKVVKEIGNDHVKLVQYKNGHWQYFVDGKPFMIKAMSYKPVKVGQSPDEGTEQDWMKQDNNNNGLIDAAYEAWVDNNNNGIQDSDEKSVGDFKLMADMGVNTLRQYHHASNKELLRDIYEKYGIMTMMGDFVGMYTVGSGAGWAEGTDYTDPQQQKNMLESVKSMVNEFKDEPYILMWVLGNENNYPGVFGHVGGGGNASKYPAEYYAFINELAKWVKENDPQDRPVAICNGDTLFFDTFAENCPDVDIYGCNSYQGNQGFIFWQDVADLYGKPVVVTEFGCPAYHEGQSKEVAEEEQADYNWGTWTDIAANSAGQAGVGNALGGVVFEWVDGWWKSGQAPFFSPYIHEPNGQWKGPFPNGWSYEEWFGLCSQGEGEESPFLRRLRKSYYVYQDLWTKSDIYDPIYAAGRINAADKDVFVNSGKGFNQIQDIPLAHEIYGLKKDNDNNLYATGNYFGQGKVWKFGGESWNEGLILDDSLVGYALTRDAEGNLWAAGAGRKKIWKIEDGSAIGENIEGASAIYAICFDNQARLWAAGANLNITNIFVRQDGQWRPGGDLLGSQTIHALAVDRRGVLWAGGKSQTNRKLWSYDEHKDKWDKGILLDGAEAVYALLVDAEGNLWAAGAGSNKVWRYNGKAWDAAYDFEDCTAIYCLTQDIEGNIYAGGWSGGRSAKIWKFNGSTWDKGTSLKGFVIRAIEAIP
jgi:beta-glucuronidase